MNTSRLQHIRKQQWYHLLPVKPGMLIEVHEKIGDWNNQRIWKFKGLVIKVRKPKHVDGTFTLRWKTSGHTIEKIYPLSFVNFEHVYLIDMYRVVRNKLYYIREKVWKDAKMKSIITAQQRNIDLLSVAKEELLALVGTTTDQESVESEEIAPEDADAVLSQESIEETTTAVDGAPSVEQHDTNATDDVQEGENEQRDAEDKEHVVWDNQEEVAHQTESVDASLPTEEESQA